MTEQDTPGPNVAKALRDLHPDPFAQAAILRLYRHAPHYLASQAVGTILRATRQDREQGR